MVALIGVEDGKASAVVGVTDDLAKSMSAVELVKAGVAALGGKGGGGRPDMAQGGGPDAAKASEALKAIEAAVGERQVMRLALGAPAGAAGAGLRSRAQQPQQPAPSSERVEGQNANPDRYDARPRALPRARSTTT